MAETGRGCRRIAPRSRPSTCPRRRQACGPCCAGAARLLDEEKPPEPTEISSATPAALNARDTGFDRTCGLWLRRRGKPPPGASRASQALAISRGPENRWTEIHPEVCDLCCSCAARPSCGPGPLTVGPYCGRGTRPEPGHGLRPDRPRRAAARPAEPERHPDPPRRPGGLCRQRDSLRLGIQMAVSISRTSIRGETGWG